jgi:hypothetical protein
MRNRGPLLLFLVLLTAAVITIACGSSQPHVLQSVTVNPAAADARDFPNGLVQFTATGNYDTSPMQITPLKATWGACIKTATSQQPAVAVTVSPNGLAQCAAGAGTFTVWASSEIPNGVMCLVIAPCGGGCGAITGTAQITCP